MFKPACLILFVVFGQPPAMVEVKDYPTCQALILTTAVATDPDADKKLEPLKPLLQPEEPAPEEK